MNRSYNSYGDLAQNGQYSEDTPHVRLFDPDTDNAGVTGVTAASGGGDNPHRVPKWHTDLKTEVATMKADMKRQFAHVNQSFTNVDQRFDKLEALITGGQNLPGQNGAAPQNPAPKRPAPTKPQQNPPAGGQSDTGRSWWG